MRLTAPKAVSAVRSSDRPAAPDDLLEAVRELWSAVEKMIDWEDVITRALDGGKDIPLRRPKYVPVAGSRAAFERDEARGKGVLVVTTILDADMAV